MKLNRFCSKCGKTLSSQEDQFICSSCTDNKIQDIILPEITILICKICGAIAIRKDLLRSNWFYQYPNESDIDFISRLLYDYIFTKMEKKESVKINIFYPENFNLNTVQQFSLVVHFNKVKEDIKKEISQKIRKKSIMCDHCANKQGNRFEAILQIRISNEQDTIRLQEILDECILFENKEKLKDSKNFIAKLEKSQNGFDLKLSTKILLKFLLSDLKKKYPFQVKNSVHLVGVDSQNGTDLYRPTVLLKLVPLIKGDQILFENINYIVQKVTTKYISIINSQNQQNLNIKISDLEKKKIQFLSR